MVPHSSGRLTSSSSRRDVLYCCGHCGYALNLSSSDRDTANIGAGYGKSIRKGVVSFAAIDESRFTHADELLCLPFFRSPRSWSLRRRQTRLLCRGCGHLIGTYHNGSDAVSSPSGGSSSESNDAENTSGSFRQYKIRIRTLQPSDDDAGTPFEEDVLPRPSLFK